MNEYQPVRVQTHIHEDGHGTVSINGHNIPRVVNIAHRMYVDQEHGGVIEEVTITVRNVRYALIDDRQKLPFDYTNADHRRLVHEALEDGRIIEAQSLGDKDGTWFDAHKSYWGEYLDWDTYNFRLKEAKK